MGKEKKTLTDALQEMGGYKARHTAGTKDLPDMLDGETVEELAMKSEHGVDWVRERIKVLMAQDKAAVGKKLTKDIMGRPIWSPCYKFVDADAK